MPMHDWKRVDAGIVHAFHHSWIEEIHRALLKRLPTDYYSLPEQIAAGVGPDTLALKSDDQNETDDGGLATKTRPKTKFYQETETEFYLSKQKAVVIHHVSGDRVVAVRILERLQITKAIPATAPTAPEVTETIVSVVQRLANGKPNSICISL